MVCVQSVVCQLRSGTDMVRKEILKSIGGPEIDDGKKNGFYYCRRWHRVTLALGASLNSNELLEEEV